MSKTLTFASAVDWPGWCRSGKTPDDALRVLAEYAGRYAAVARIAHVRFDPWAADELTVVDETEGDATTGFGAPGKAAPTDDRPLTRWRGRPPGTAARGAWAGARPARGRGARAAAQGAARRRPGPRQGRRPRRSRPSGNYARTIGVRHPPFHGGPGALEACRAEVEQVLRAVAHRRTGADVVGAVLSAAGGLARPRPRLGDRGQVRGGTADDVHVRGPPPARAVALVALVSLALAARPRRTGAAPTGPPAAFPDRSGIDPAALPRGPAVTTLHTEGTSIMDGRVTLRTSLTGRLQILGRAGSGYIVTPVPTTAATTRCGASTRPASRTGWPRSASTATTCASPRGARGSRGPTSARTAPVSARVLSATRTARSSTSGGSRGQLRVVDLRTRVLLDRDPVRTAPCGGGAVADRVSVVRGLQLQPGRHGGTTEPSSWSRTR